MALARYALAFARLASPLSRVLMTFAGAPATTEFAGTTVFSFKKLESLCPSSVQRIGVESALALISSYAVLTLPWRAGLSHMEFSERLPVRNGAVRFENFVARARRILKLPDLA